MSNSKITLKLILAATVTSVLSGILSGFGTKFDYWHFSTGFTILQWSVYLAAALVPLIGYILYQWEFDSSRKRWLLVGSLVTILIYVAVPLNWYWTAKTVPPFHDITTDTKNPPAFKAVVDLRKNASNPVEYPGESVAQKQKEAYPEVHTMRLTRSFEEVFSTAKKVAKDLGWNIIASKPTQGRIEAVAETFWFGFKDDIVVRLTTEMGQTLVDVRSKSRVGKSDLGTNAQRIRIFLYRLKREL